MIYFDVLIGYINMSELVPLTRPENIQSLSQLLTVFSFSLLALRTKQTLSKESKPGWKVLLDQQARSLARKLGVPMSRARTIIISDDIADRYNQRNGR